AAQPAALSRTCRDDPLLPPGRVRGAQAHRARSRVRPRRGRTAGAQLVSRARTGRRLRSRTRPVSVDALHPDVVVIGGGPAGSTASTLMAQQGLRVSLFERERFPRFHIGESLIPETYWVLKRLNMLPKMQRRTL